MYGKNKIQTIILECRLLLVAGAIKINFFSAAGDNDTPMQTA